MRVLAIGAEQRSEISRVREYAEAHPFSSADLERLSRTPEGYVGDDPNFTCALPVGYQVTYK